MDVSFTVTGIIVVSLIIKLDYSLNCRNSANLIQYKHNCWRTDSSHVWFSCHV